MSPSPLLPGSSSHSASLVDVLDRVLDKGLVVAGDIKVSLAEVELLTIRTRLLERKIASRAGSRLATRSSRAAAQCRARIARAMGRIQGGQDAN